MPRQGIMLATPYDIKRFKKWGSKAFIQPKLNGERCRAVIDEEGRCHLRSSENNEIISVPHINKALEASGLKGIELDGELYVHGMDFDEIRSRVGRTVNLHPDYKDIEFHCFDTVSSNNQHMRLITLYGLDIFKGCIQRVIGWKVTSELEIMNAYEKFMEKGYEGFILRHTNVGYERKRVTTMMKHKPRETDTYKIIGYAEEVDKNNKPKNQMGSLHLKGDLGDFWVGSGMTQEEREFFWAIKDRLIGRDAEIEYQYLTAKRGVPRHPVFIKVI